MDPRGWRAARASARHQPTAQTRPLGRRDSGDACGGRPGPLLCPPYLRRGGDQRHFVTPPPPPRTKWTRRVLHPVLIGHAVCLVFATRKRATAIPARHDGDERFRGARGRAAARRCARSRGPPAPGRAAAGPPPPARCRRPRHRSSHSTRPPLSCRAKGPPLRRGSRCAPPQGPPACLRCVSQVPARPGFGVA